MSDKEQPPVTKLVDVMESRGAVSLPTNAASNPLIDRYVTNTQLGPTTGSAAKPTASTGGAVAPPSGGNDQQ